jgi:hypothetical protein
MFIATSDAVRSRSVRSETGGGTFSGTFARSQIKKAGNARL